MLRASGNMKIPGGLNVMMCLLDVVFNFFLIFPTREISILGHSLLMPGAGLGVLGAALGTVGAEVVTAGFMMWYACFRQKGIAIFGRRAEDVVTHGLKSFMPTRNVLLNAMKVSAPMTLEHGVMGGTYVCGVDCCLRSHGGRGRHACSCCDEFFEYMACASSHRRTAGTHDGARRCVARHVYRAMFPRVYIPFQAYQGVLAQSWLVYKLSVVDKILASR